MARWVLLAEVSGGRVRGWQRLGWMDGVKMALGNRGMRERSERVESSGTYVTEWVHAGIFCLALCSFGPSSRALVVITRMPLHDAVGINCEKGATTENESAGVKYMG